MVSGVIDLGIAMDAIRLGTYDYITKPFNVDDMLVKVQRAVERHRLVTENSEYQRDWSVSSRRGRRLSKGAWAGLRPSTGCTGSIWSTI